MADAGSPNATAATIASRRHARLGASADASVSPASAWATGDGIRTYVPERYYQRRVAAAADFRLKAEATSAPRPRSPHAPRTPHLCPLPRPHPQALFPLPDTSPRTSHSALPQALSPGPLSFARHLTAHFALCPSPDPIPRPSFLCPTPHRAFRTLPFPQALSPGPLSFARPLTPHFALRTSALSPGPIPRPSFLCPRARTSSSVTTLVRISVEPAEVELGSR